MRACIRGAILPPRRTFDVWDTAAGVSGRVHGYDRSDTTRVGALRRGRGATKLVSPWGTVATPRQVLVSGSPGGHFVLVLRP